MTSKESGRVSEAPRNSSKKRSGEIMKHCPLKPYMPGASKYQLRIGTKIELEHTNDKTIARRIASQHLAEIPNYYTLLKKMERRAMNK